MLSAILILFKFFIHSTVFDKRQNLDVVSLKLKQISSKLTRTELIELSADALRCVYHRKNFFKS